MWGLYATLAVAVGVCVIIYILAVLAETKNIETLSGFFRGTVTPDTATLPEPHTYTIGFWTPSEETAAFWTAKGRVDKEQNEWEAEATLEKNVDFGEFLSLEHAVQGYRRYRVWGQGRGTLKPGFWWVVGVENWYPPKSIVSKYVEFWDSPDAVYVEVVWPKASHLPPGAGEQQR